MPGRFDHLGEAKAIAVQKYRFSSACVGIAVGTQQEAIALRGRDLGKAEVDLLNPQIHTKKFASEEQIFIGQLRGSGDDD